jgi:hypothetical protein
MSPDPWWRKFVDNPPPLPDRIWTFLLMWMIALLGFVLGLTVCVVREAHAPALTTPALQQHMHSLEQRPLLQEHH